MFAITNWKLMITKELAYEGISELVTRFDEQYESYKRSDYNETQTRRDFIDPFFKALSWDVDNSQGNAEAYREVIHDQHQFIEVNSRSVLPAQLGHIEWRIGYCEGKIDEMVHELYWVMEEERKIIEGN